MATPFPCSRCKTELTPKLPVPSTIVCPQCRMTHIQGKDGTAAREEVPAPPPSPQGLRVGLTGEVDGTSFVITGRTVQSQGKNRWSEWALLDKDGKTHFVSDANGALHLLKLRGTRQNAPSPAKIIVGERIELQPGEVFHVKERGETIVVSAEGELPYEVTLGERIAFADLEAVGGALATLDWREGMDNAPDLWDGYSTTAADLGLSVRAAGPTSFTCPNCKQVATLQLGADAITMACPKCEHVFHHGDEGWVTSGAQPPGHGRALLGIGRTGTIRGESLQVCGIMRRACVVDGETYGWTEYFCLVKDRAQGTPEQRHRWLLEQDGHWSVIRPLGRGDVSGAGAGHVLFQGDTFKEFSVVRAVTEHIVGEQPYWAQNGDVAIMADFVKPPRMVSFEDTGEEQFWTLGDYIPRSEMQQAFPGIEFPPPDGVAPNQPNPARGNAMWTLLLTAAFWAVILLVYFVISGGARRHELFRAEVHPGSAPTSPETDPTAAAGDSAYYSDPIEIRTNRRNVQVEVLGGLDNDWESVDVTLIHEATGEVRGTTLNMEFYSGVEDGYGWSEGSLNDTGYLADVPAGTHILRVDTECGRKPCPPVLLMLRSDVPRPLFAFLMLFLLALVPILAFAYAQYTETRRWMNSTNVSHGGEG